MRKTVVYIVILGIFGFGVWFFLFKDTNLFGEDEAGFTIKDTASVERIFLANTKGNSISLKRTEKGWIVNDKFPSSKGMIKTLLTTFKTQFPAYPVPENAHNNVIKNLTGNAIKVEVFGEKDEPIRTFFVGGQTTGNKGTYMLIDGATRPYVVQLPVYQGYVTPRYSIEEKEWRDRTVMDLLPEQIQQVKVDYASEEEYLNSFTMKLAENGSFIIETHPELKLSEPINTRRVKAFSRYFQKIGLEGYLNGIEGMDSTIANMDKRCTITVTDVNNNVQNIDIYWMPVSRRSKNLLSPDPDIPNEYDPDRFYGIINNNRDTVILQRYTFDKLFRKGYEFFEKDVQ